MKKIAVMLFCLALVSVHAFAEFVMVPGLGLSHYYGSTGEKESMSMIPFGVGLDFSYLTDSGFTLCMDNDFQYFLKVKNTVEGVSPVSMSVNKSLVWNARIMPGYTFKFAKDKAYLRLAGGPAIGTMGWEVEKAVYTAITVGLAFHVGFAGIFGKSSFISFTVPIDLDIKYYFTHSVGISISGMGTFGIGTFITSSEIPVNSVEKYLARSFLMPPLSANFAIKIGPTIRIPGQKGLNKKIRESQNKRR